MLKRRPGSLGTGAWAASGDTRADVPFQTKKPPMASTATTPRNIARRDLREPFRLTAAALSKGKPRGAERVTGWIVGDRTAEGRPEPVTFEGLVVVVSVGGRRSRRRPAPPPPRSRRNRA